MKEHGAYSGTEARSYDSDREREPLWHVENAHVAGLVRRISPRSVLDVPVGTGRFLSFYAGARVLGVDLSEPMLAQAAERVAAEGLQGVTLQQGDVTALPFGDREFELVVCWRLLHLLPPDVLQPALQEMKRVCGGHLCVQIYERAVWPERVAAKAKRWLRRLGLLWKREAQLTPWSHIRSWSHSAEEIAQAARAAGLDAPIARDDLGGYEGTRVVALTWRVAG